MISVTALELHVLENELNDKKEKFLLQQGWSMTCQLPGSYWYWTKVLPGGKQVYVSRESALSLETALR